MLSASSMKAAIAVRIPLFAWYASRPNLGENASSGVGTGEKVFVSWLKRAMRIFMVRFPSLGSVARSPCVLVGTAAGYW